MTLKVAQFIDSLDPARGGVVTYITDLALLLAKADIDVRIVSSVVEPRSESLTDSCGVTLQKVPAPDRRVGRFSPSALNETINRLSEADIVHLHGCWAMTNHQVARRLEARNIPYVITPHGMLDDWWMRRRSLKKRLFMRLVGRRTFRNARRVIYCAEGERAQSECWTGNPVGDVIPAAMDLDPYLTLPGPDLARREISGADGEGPVVLFLSRLFPMKGLELLIDAMALVAEQRSPVPLILAGTGDDGYVDGLRARIRDRGIDEHTHLVGLVRGDTKVSLFQRASVFALPTRQENFGIALTESLAAATPVITTAGVDIAPEIRRHEAGWIVERTPRAVADAILNAIEEPDHARAVGDRGRAWILSAHEATTLAAQYVASYRAALDASSSR